MKKSGAWLAVHALEQLGIRHTFGIPGVHTTELYDELNSSATITPVLVTHEAGAAYMADAVSRVSDSVGTLAIVPAAGLTHAASGIAEALLAGVPMLIVSGGIRTDLDKGYQLHEIDQHAFMRPLTKATYHLKRHEEIIPGLFEAHRVAVSGEPGPVFVELPVNLQMFPGEVGELPVYTPPAAVTAPAPEAVALAVDLLAAARHPGVFAGWGAREATADLVALADLLQAPVATTLQGLSVFPADHPLHAGFGYGPAAVPAARNAFRRCDCLLAVGTRFGEIATGSFGISPPKNLVHVDINPAVFHRNYPAKVTIEGDAPAVVKALLEALRARLPARAPDAGPAAAIRRDKRAWREQWLAHPTPGRVNPAVFFDALRAQAPDDAIAAVDDGNHTYLTAELFPVHRTKCLILPTDFNCMGYAIPAAIGAKIARPEREVFAIVGDGAFMMTCMEIATATQRGLGVVLYVFRDGELSQIAQAQKIPYNRAPCTTLAPLELGGLATATGAAYVAMRESADAEAAIAEARRIAAGGRPVIVDVNIDYSKRTAFTQGAVKTNFGRFPLAERLRIAGRALLRRITG